MGAELAEYRTGQELVSSYAGLFANDRRIPMMPSRPVMLLAWPLPVGTLLGHNARLMPAKYVRPYSRGQKNDFRDDRTCGRALSQDGGQLSAQEMQSLPHRYSAF